MPGWHAKTKQLVQDGKLVVAGLAPEQHGDRMALFLQWKGMEDMPVMIDSFNILGLKAVPITLLIDEAGIIRYRNPSDKNLAAFLALPPAEVDSGPKAPQLTAGLMGIDPAATIPWTVDLDHLATLLADPQPPEWSSTACHFQLGVAYRKRYDSKQRQPTDFASAVAQWTTALKRDPSNYIWRRRLQQYGPVLDKPYPFYNWIEQARTDITARGDKPHPLVTEPGEAELAIPSKRPGSVENLPPHPDPDGKLLCDTEERFLVMTAVVPHTKKPDRAVRGFIEIQPKAAHQAKWNDEAGLSTVHIKAPPGWIALPPVVTLMPTTHAPLSSARRVEFEMHREGASPNENPVATAEIFLQSCSGSEGLCQFLRRDVQLPLP